MDKSSIKVAVGLSGGVDSSVAALLLKREGYDVFALFMQNWHDTTGTLHGECEWEEDYSVAKMVAEKIGIPFHFIDLSNKYRQDVVNYMFSEYEKGRTPNPDVLCNTKIKFDAFLNAALELGADYVATGHYCRKETTIDEKGEAIFQIFAGTDPNKDQTYFLCGLTQKQLSKALFPIGDLLKPKVREIAREASLPSAEKKDSQGICFVGKVNLPAFLQQQLEPRKGNIVEIFADFYDQLVDYPGYGSSNISLHTVQSEANGLPTKEVTFSTNQYFLNNLSEQMLDETLQRLVSRYPYQESDGKVIGTHFGAQFFTIGQRKGLNVGGHKESIFIIATDINTNTIYVGEGHSHPGLLRKALVIDSSDVHWIREDLAMKVGDHREYLVRIRYRQPLQKATLYCRREGLYIVFEDHQRGISSGQFAVWYSEQLEMVGSGVIS